MKRRDFLKGISCGTMSSNTLLSTLANLGVVNGVMANSSILKNDAEDYKAIVCILLSGGVDSYNMLIPSGSGSGSDHGYDDYLGVRTDLAVQNVNDLLNLNIGQHVPVRGVSNAYNSFGLHPTMPELRQLFNQGDLAFMSNIGTLVEPLMNFSDFENSQKLKPLGLYSHSDQSMQWQTSIPQSRDAVGFGGRIADLLHAANTNQGLSMNISLNGKNLFQRGNEISEYAIANDISSTNIGYTSFPSWWSNSGYLTHLRDKAIDNMVAKTYNNALENAFSTTAKSSIAAFDILKKSLSKVPTISTIFPNSSLADDLGAIARLISVRNELGVKRQVFFVNLGGWDMHDDLISGLNMGFPIVSQALKAFYDVTVELGVQDKVTTFTISDFARTITSNGQGSDHAWGGNSIVMGGAVNGGKIYGGYPQMDIFTNPKNVSFRGNFIPAVSTDELYAELALWYGVSPSDLCYVLPNLGNFYSYSNGVYPLGLMDMSNGVSIINQP
jgi:uncharacterized protein (DUF1501 family)